MAKKAEGDRFFSTNRKEVIQALGKKKLLEALSWMFLIRNFELRGEAAYLQGKVGGFFHSYMGQEAIQTAALYAFGKENWFIATYRCHALALLLGVSPNELMAELYGKVTGNAQGRGGSMHLFADRMLGGFGIVGGHVPIAAGAAFALKYQGKKKECAICFLGDGALAQGAVHEGMNLASLWDLPCIFVIENNQWGMGTHVDRAICVKHLAEERAPGYNMKAYTVNGMDFFNCYSCFRHIYEEVLKTSRPVLVEAITERFKGHSISDPGLYRTKDDLQKIMKRDPLPFMQEALIEAKVLDQKKAEKLNQEEKDKVIAAMNYVDESPWPELSVLGEGVLVPYE